MIVAERQHMADLLASLSQEQLRGRACATHGLSTKSARFW
jgi:hypothetical protein